MVAGGAAHSPGRGYDIHAEERRRMWFDHYVSLGQYSAAQRIADADDVPAHAPPSLRLQPGSLHENVRVAGLQLPAFDPRHAAVIIQKSVRGEQARAASQWLREEKKHRVWLQYCIETEQYDAAAGLGLFHELAAITIQRAFRRTLVASNGYELGCPNCHTAFILRKVPEGRVSHRCPTCQTKFMVEVTEQAWWKYPKLLEPEDPKVLQERAFWERVPFNPNEAAEMERARQEWIR
jgi:hypothetical protein